MSIEDGALARIFSHQNRVFGAVGTPDIVEVGEF